VKRNIEMTKTPTIMNKCLEIFDIFDTFSYYWII